MAKKYEELTLADNFMFGKIASNPRNCELILESLFDEKIELQKMPELEKFMQVKKNGKFIRLDLYAEDDKRIFDAEMQNKSQNSERQIELPKRSRYYQSVIDANFLKSGMSYRDLKESYVVFICNFDPYGKGLYQYVFTNSCKNAPNLELGDQAYKIFFNTKAENLQEAPPKLRAFLEYIETNQPDSDITRELDVAVQDARLNEEWGSEYMLSLGYLMDAQDEGRAIGIAEGKAEGRAMGIAEGRAEGMSKGILIILQKLGEVPEELSAKILGEPDADRLEEWLNKALSVSSVAEFEKSIG